MILRQYLLFAALLATLPQALADTAPRIAIIIDDLGYHLETGHRAIGLPGPLAYAILPGTPRGRLLAEAAHRNGKEVLLHLPLQAIEQPQWAEPGGITLDMSETALRDAFAAALESVPFAIGVSSHRGSLLTRHPGHMFWLMQEIRARDDLWFDAGDPTLIDVTQLGGVGVSFGSFDHTTDCGEGFGAGLLELLVDLFIGDVETLVRDAFVAFLGTVPAGDDDPPIAAAIENALAGIEISGPIGAGLQGMEKALRIG